MKHEEILASVAVLTLAGVLVYLTKIGVLVIGGNAARNSKIAANQAVAAARITGAGGDASDLIGGPQIYLGNTPWPFGANVGNVLPTNSAGVTLPGANPADFLGFQAV